MLNLKLKSCQGIEESYPNNLPAEDVAKYIACEKANAYKQGLQEDELVITADTVVVVDQQVRKVNLET